MSPPNATEDKERNSEDLIRRKDEELCLPINLECSGHLSLQLYSLSFVRAVQPHQDGDRGHPDATEATSQQRILDPQPLTLPSEAMEDWDHGHPDATKDEGRKMKMKKENTGTVINDLNQPLTLPSEATEDWDHGHPDATKDEGRKMKKKKEKPQDTPSMKSMGNQQSPANSTLPAVLGSPMQCNLRDGETPGKNPFQHCQNSQPKK